MDQYMAVCLIDVIRMEIRLVEIAAKAAVDEILNCIVAAL